MAGWQASHHVSSPSSGYLRRDENDTFASSSSSSLYDSLSDDPNACLFEFHDEFDGWDGSMGSLDDLIAMCDHQPADDFFDWEDFFGEDALSGSEAAISELNCHQLGTMPEFAYQQGIDPDDHIPDDDPASFELLAENFRTCPAGHSVSDEEQPPNPSHNIVAGSNDAELKYGGEEASRKTPDPLSLNHELHGSTETKSEKTPKRKKRKQEHKSTLRKMAMKHKQRKTALKQKHQQQQQQQQMMQGRWHNYPYAEIKELVRRDISNYSMSKAMAVQGEWDE